MNHFYTISLFTLIAATQLCSLNAMRRTLEEASETLSLTPEVQVTETLVCLDVNRILPYEIDLLIVKQIVLLHADRSFENSLDTTSPDNLCISLGLICDKIPELGHLTPSDQELGAVLAAHLAKRNTSLLTLVDEDKCTVLYRTPQTQNILPRVIPIICFAAGADVQELVMMQDRADNTALHIAADCGRIAIFQALLSTPGVNVSQLVMVKNNNGQTAMHFAAYEGYIDTIQALLSARSVNTPLLVMMQDNDGKTALHNAVRYGHTSTVQALLSFLSAYPGINVSQHVMVQQDNMGFTVLDSAEQQANKDIVVLLQPYTNQNNQ